ncbi:hypothetical protein BZL29_2228 [Mycobacterium kansasii]|uniref:Uncharacterized protein n=1 Tax=Mycobacterium kansasii TaxID=1768 RepID=A0A1V3XLN4_MYCKA|nr:hypothetical protein BZL29_2228 [Mycobacterium kansasii]
MTFLALALPILLTGLVCTRLPSLRELDRAPEEMPRQSSPV